MKEWSWTCLLLRIGERKFSPGFTAPKLLEMRYNRGRSINAYVLDFRVGEFMLRTRL